MGSNGWKDVGGFVNGWGEEKAHDKIKEWERFNLDFRPL